MIESFLLNEFRVEISEDQDIESPRTFENFSKMICYCNKYQLGDENPKCYPDEYLYQVMCDRELFVNSKSLPDEIKLEDIHKYINKHFYFLPLYLYDHSGISISTRPFSCPWDSRQIGFIYAPRGCFDGPEGFEILEEEVKVYNQYLNGEVYYYVVKDQEGDILDFCGGFYSLKDCKAEAVNSASYISSSQAKIFAS
jgi:hypothetical protein